MSKSRVYGLVASNNRGDLKYVGVTKGELSSRLASHKNECKQSFSSEKTRWMNKVYSDGFKVEIHLIKEVPTEERLYWENHYIKLYLNKGFKLVNGILDSSKLHDYTELTVSKTGKTVRIYDKDSKKLLKICKSMVEAAQFTNINPKRIEDVASNRPDSQGKIRWASKGYIFIKEGDSLAKYSKRKELNRIEVIKRREERKAETKRNLKPRYIKLTPEEMSAKNKNSSMLAVEALRKNRKFDFCVYKDGELVNKYMLIADGVRDLGLNYGGVSKCLYGNRKSHRGYTFARENL